MDVEMPLLVALRQDGFYLFTDESRAVVGSHQDGDAVFRVVLYRFHIPVA
jgi:hypothetical protein